MANIIVAFAKQEDAKCIKNILMRNGFDVVAVCTSGAQAISSTDGLSSGIVVCGFRFRDMIFTELKSCLPQNFEMLLVASPNKWSGQDVGSTVCLPMPLKIHDLVTTLEMMCESQRKRKRKLRQLQPPKRNEGEKEIIEEAKRLLIERNQMSEEEAHRYIQKCSMTSGCNLVETAQMVISLNNK